MAKIERAILSCYDKNGLVELAQLLREYEVELISTSGTLQVLQDADIEATSIADFTGVEEMMGGRVKSLHPMVHAGLLGIRDNKLHVEQMQAYEMQWLDLAVVNLQPPEKLVAQPGITMDEIIEQTDIGGSAMIRSAAKNFRYVSCLVNPSQYALFMHELRAHNGEISFSTRLRWAQEAFHLTGHYDQVIGDYLSNTEPPLD